MNSPFTFLSAALLLLISACSPSGPHGSVEHGHDHAEHEGESSLSFSAQARLHLGIEVSAARLDRFTVSEPIPAVVKVPPDQIRPVPVPIAGRVGEVCVRQGQAVVGGDVLFRVIRSPLPRIELALTRDLLLPVSEEVHQTAVELGVALRELELAERELHRLKEVNETSQGGSLIPRQRIVEMEYSTARAEKNISSLRARLRLHGLEEKQIEDLVAGKATRFDETRWRASLKANALWGEGPQRVYEAMPPRLHQQPWFFAGLGELHGAGLLKEDVVDWLVRTPGVPDAFYEIAGLLQAGSSLREVQSLYQAGAFAPVVEVRAPGGAEDEWDVMEVAVREGESVSSGTLLAYLQDSRHLQLEAQPVGRELAILREALRGQATLQAGPLAEGTGIPLADLRIQQLFGAGADAAAVARVPFENEVLLEQEKDGARYRTWAVLPETRYELEVPVRQLDSCWVFPATAVVEKGGRAHVFVENGDSFLPREVAVIFQDDKVVVLDSASGLFPGDRIVTAGAFALQLAFDAAGSGGVDPHAGHSH